MTSVSTDQTEFGGTCSNGHWTVLAVADGHLNVGDLMPPQVLRCAGFGERDGTTWKCATCGERLQGRVLQRRHVSRDDAHGHISTDSSNCVFCGAEFDA
jgi:hypothetical protein